MAIVIIQTDSIIQVYSSSIKGSGIGSLSKYVDKPHPGTNKEIEGFQWDFRNWPDDKELEAISYAPSIWDPSKDFIPSEEFQSGIGDNNDLLLLSIDKSEAQNKEVWIPRVQHGYFYVEDQEWYLFSDDFQAQSFNKNQTYSGLQYVNLKYDLKPAIPIQVKRYKYNSLTGEYGIDLNLRKKVDFSGKKVSGIEQTTITTQGIVILSNIDTTKEEFIVSDRFGLRPRILLNKDYSANVGGAMTLTVSGTVATGSLDNLEVVGIGDGTATEFHTEYSPIDPSGVIQLFTWSSTNSISQWTRINNTASFTNGASKEFKLDENLGIISFGTYESSTGAGLVPQAGTKIAITYPKGLQVEYEPKDSRDYILANTADVNPLHNATEKGFIKLSTEIADAGSISLSVDLPVQFGTGAFLIDAGNTTGEVIATVYDSEGEVLEGAQVFFELLDPIVGNFTNGDDTTSSISNTNGEATAFYAPPVSIDALGKATTNVSYDGGTNTTTISIDGLSPPDTVSGVFLYKVMKNDDVLGMAESAEATHYANFFTDENIIGTTANQSYETNRRITNSLLTPKLYSNGDITTGAKIILFSIDNAVIDSHRGAQYPGTVYAPIMPISVQNTGSNQNPQMKLIYAGNIPAPDGATDFKSYFTVGESTTLARAYIINKKNNKKIYSNTVTFSIQIPKAANGVLIANTLADIQADMFNRVRNINEFSDAQILATQAGLNDQWLTDRFPSGETYVSWFRRTRRGDSEQLGLLDYTFSGTVPARIPFGFKLKDSGITVASLLDSVTFLDINDILPSGYFE